VAGVEEERRARAVERLAELADRLDHVLARGVLAHDHLEAELLQRLARSRASFTALRSGCAAYWLLPMRRATRSAARAARQASRHAAAAAARIHAFLRSAAVLRSRRRPPGRKIIAQGNAVRGNPRRARLRR
jgi:hypothetical protein